MRSHILIFSAAFLMILSSCDGSGRKAGTIENYNAVQATERKKPDTTEVYHYAYIETDTHQVDTVFTFNGESPAVSVMVKAYSLNDSSITSSTERINKKGLLYTYHVYHQNMVEFTIETEEGQPKKIQLNKRVFEPIFGEGYLNSTMIPWVAPHHFSRNHQSLVFSIWSCLPDSDDCDAGFALLDVNSGKITFQKHYGTGCMDEIVITKEGNILSCAGLHSFTGEEILDFEYPVGFEVLDSSTFVFISQEHMEQGSDQYPDNCFVFSNNGDTLHSFNYDGYMWTLNYFIPSIKLNSELYLFDRKNLSYVRVSSSGSEGGLMKFMDEEDITAEMKSYQLDHDLFDYWLVIDGYTPYVVRNSE